VLLLTADIEARRDEIDFELRGQWRCWFFRGDRAAGHEFARKRGDGFTREGRSQICKERRVTDLQESW